MSSIENSESLALTRAATENRPLFLDRIAARLVREALERVEHGRVVMTLPDGSVERFGASGAEVRVHIRRWSALRRLLLGGDTGAAEAFRDGDWDADDLVGVVSLFVANAELFDRETPLSFVSDALNRVRHALRRNTRRKAKRNIEAHYDLGNAFYELFLDRSMTYSCALFENAGDTLEAAQERKLRRVAELARLTPGASVLEIGCGWGSFATLAAREYGCRVVGLTLSNEQADFARRRVAREGLEDRVEIRLADYRTLDGRKERFDRIVSVEMLEAVGHEFLPAFFETCDDVLERDGLLFLQTIAIPENRHARLLRRPDFIQKHIFPGSQLPSTASITSALSKTALALERLEEIGPHYVETLRRWRTRFLARREEALSLGFPEGFLRLWEYYLAYCEGGFLSRYVKDVQMVLTRPVPCYEAGRGVK